ncbi:MAG: thiamine/thiamine pyrophosphate ABC transporter permease ThiP [Pseudomonadota bacterium]
MGPGVLLGRWAGPVRAAGWAALALVALLVLGSLAAVVATAEGGAEGLGPAGLAALRFTLVQAVLSTALSVALAVPLARALARRAFPGRGALLALLGAPFILPVIVAVFGLLAVWGRSGWLSGLGGAARLGPLDIYGLSGVVLAHVFFNLPLVTRLLLERWAAVPAERFRLAAQLGFGPGAVFRRIEWPLLREALPGAALLVFLLTLTSFAVALILGGGPAATTLEVAIYQAIRFEFDFAAAARLATVQLALCALAAAVALRLRRPVRLGAPLGRPVVRWDVARGLWRAADRAAIGLAAAFLIGPLVAVFLAGLPGLAGGLPAPVWAAAGRSLLVALGSAALAVGLALALGLLIDGARRGAVLEGAAVFGLAASPFVLGTGLFVLVFPVASPAALALPVTMAVNAAMALPFALALLVPALRAAREGVGPLAQSLGMTGWAWLRLGLWPRIRRPVAFAAGLSAALSMGDLGVVTLFAPPDGGTLPLQMQRLMAAYRMEEAAGAGLLLTLLAFSLFRALDRAGGRP